MAYDILFWAITFDFAGKFLIATTALLTHRVMIIEKHIDKLVLKDLKFEVGVGVLGLIMLIIGYVLHFIYFRGI